MTIVAPAVEKSESAVILDRLTAYRSNPQKEPPSVVEIPTDYSVTHANNATVSLAAVIEMPKPAIEEIAQRDLSEYLLYLKELRMCRMNVRNRRQEIVAKLSAGAEVEDGPLEAALLTVKRGTKSLVRLMVRV